MIRSRCCSKSDANPVPRVDRRYRKRQVDQFLLVEFRFGDLKYLVRHVSLGDQRQRLGPSERRAFAVGVKGRFTPGIQQIKPLLGLALGAQLLECMSRQ